LVKIPSNSVADLRSITSRASTTEEGVHVSVVVPLYRCEECVAELYSRLVISLEAITGSFEIVLVNDGSPQDDWVLMRQIALRDPRVKAINLSRNFGQHYALSAGLAHAGGDWVVVMDGDLQDPPEEIATLYAKAIEGHDIVFGRMPVRAGSLFKRATSRAFSSMLGFLMDEKLDNAVTHFSIVSRDVVRNLRRFQERNRSYAFLLRWLGFDVAYVDVKHHARHAGTSSYTLPKLLRHASELVVSQSDKPLRLSINFGFAVALLAFAYGLFMILRYLFHGTPPTGWTSLIVSIYFLGGLGFMALGIVGLYIGSIFEETKHRPLYVIKETMNLTAPPPAASQSDYNPASPPRDVRADQDTSAARQVERF
jgi:glycosyltransferase involved in cell wall biosynthesis